jgi:hypothetical protein
MNKLPKQKRDHLILICLGTLAVIAALWMTVITSQKRSLDSLQKRKADMQEKVAKANNLLKKGSTLEGELSDKIKTLEAIETSMPAGDLYSWMVTHLDQLRNPEKIRNWVIGKEVVGEVEMFAKFPYRAARFQCRGNAYFHDLGRLLADIENRFPFFRIQNVDIAPTSGTTGDDRERLEFRFEVVALIRPTNS